MEPHKRIAELEGDVHALSGLVARLLAAREGRPHDVAEDRLPVAVLRDRVDAALDGPPAPVHEPHHGAFWLSRTVLGLLAVLLAAGLRGVLLAEGLDPWQKLALLYAAGTVLLAAGIYLWRHHDVFSEGFSGAGLGLLYLAVFATLAPPALRQVTWDTLPAVLLPAAMALLLAAAWRARSETIAILVGLAACAAACWAAATGLTPLAYALCLVLAAAAALTQFSRGWLLLSWLALLTVHGCLQLAVPAPEPPDPGAIYLLEQTTQRAPAFLAVFALCYALLAIAALADCRCSGCYRRSVATHALVNTLLFLRIAWPAAQARLGALDWAFWAVLATAWLLAAILAERPGRTRNTLFPLLLALAAAAAALAVITGLPRPLMLAALGLEGLLLAIAYKRSGVVFLKVLGLAIAALATGLGLAWVRETDITSVLGRDIPRNLAAALAMALVFALTAAFYERFTRWVRPAERRWSGQWFLADASLNWRGASLAIAHAAAAALLLVATTIFQYGDDPRLPYLLAAEGLCFAVFGLVLLTPQLGVGCVFLLLAAHLCYYAFLALPLPGFEAQPNYLALTVGLALFTYLGAWLWERYVRLFHDIGPEWEHHLLVTGPYLAATALLGVLAWRTLGPGHLPGALGVLTLGLLLLGWATGFHGISGSAVLALAAGAVALGIPTRPDPATPFPWAMLAYPALCVVAERLLALKGRRTPTEGDRYLRALLALAALAGAAALLLLHGPHDQAPLLLAVTGAAAIGVGGGLGEARYRWGGVLLLAFTLGWVATRWVPAAPVAQGLAFGVPATLTLVVSWIWLRTRRGPREG